MTDIRRTTCPYDCPASCGLLATIENGRVAGVAGDPEHPASKGLICKKCSSISCPSTARTGSFFL